MLHRAQLLFQRATRLKYTSKVLFRSVLLFANNNPGQDFLLTFSSGHSGQSGETREERRDSFCVCPYLSIFCPYLSIFESRFSAMDALDRRLGHLEAAVYGNSATSASISSSSLDDVVGQLLTLSKDCGNAIEKRERIAPIMRRTNDIRKSVETDGKNEGTRVQKGSARKRLKSCCTRESHNLAKWWCGYFYFFLNAFILWNNSGCDKLTKTLPCGIPRPTRTQATRCGNIFAFLCFDFRVGLGTWRGSALTVQPPLKSPQTTCYCNFFLSNYTELYGESNPGHLLGRQRR
jgi:hypothetical protein